MEIFVVVADVDGDAAVDCVTVVVDGDAVVVDGDAVVDVIIVAVAVVVDVAASA